MRLTIELDNLSELEKVIQLLQSLQIKDIKILSNFEYNTKVTKASENKLIESNIVSSSLPPVGDGKGILRSTGVMSEEEAAEMYEALTDTENIDQHGW